MVLNIRTETTRNDAIEAVGACRCGLESGGSALDVLTCPAVVLLGHFGSGKSEIAINLAFGLRTGLVANTHLMDETTPETVREGIRAVRELGATTGLPVRFCVMQRSVADVFGGAEETAGHLPILTIERHIVAPFATPPPGACRRSRAV